MIADKNETLVALGATPCFFSACGKRATKCVQFSKGVSHVYCEDCASRLKDWTTHLKAEVYDF